MFKISGLACTLALLGSGAAFGQEVVQETQTTTTPAGTTQLRRVSRILGSTVRLQGNNNFGKVDDVVLDQNGNIAYLVVANGGRYAMFPWNPADFNYGQRYVAYNVTPQTVQPLFFAENAWPNITDRQFTTRIRQAFPNAAPVRREVLRPVEGAIPAPAPGAVVPAPGTVAPAPGGAVIKEKIKEKPNGTVKVKETVK
ncbi:MAG: PRC-barrel domain-containing protein [Isosphaeraceae bacterium]|nr:PRC-barrel domain-containing protein [Isosphaeraceae bacterium]